MLTSLAPAVCKAKQKSKNKLNFNTYENSEPSIYYFTDLC